MMTNLEILSPARDLKCGMAAIDHGADAVYIGANKFGARASAGNSIEDIETLCHYAHQYGAKVYVTVNTIIYDRELKETVKLVNELERIGVDAILLQDMGLLNILRKEGITIAIHASTQTDNRNADKVKWLASMGIKRVVLARELSVEEIAEIHKAVPDVELEVFVHGALCVSYSGQCYASQYCFGRSANRGECAQFCRMAFDLLDANDNMIESSRHLLSLRDMAQLDNLERLAKAGAVSFKIEGRLKDIDYVKNITAAYSERLNEICHKAQKKFKRTSMGRCSYTFVPDIAKSFNRGFTTYFADGRRGKMASWDTPKAIGEPVGRVKEIRGRSFNVSTTTQFTNGDGLCFFNKANELIGFRVNKAENNRLFPQIMPKDLLPGTQLFRNHDQAFEALLAKPSAVRKVGINMILDITKEEISLTVKDEHGNRHTTSAPYTPQEARTPQGENIKRQLTKTGNTIYECRSIDIRYQGEVPFIANSMLSELRRQALEGLANSYESSKHPATELTDSNTHVPEYRYSYLYNVANKEAKRFYAEKGIQATAFETNAVDTEEAKVLMQCRYCIKAEMGYCSKKAHGNVLNEPLQIRLSDGKRFKLRFNCKKCEMEVLA